MKAITRWLIFALAMSAPRVVAAQGFYQYYDKEPRSKVLGAVGVATALVGVAVLGPWGKQYSILGESYCVTDYAVDYGPCLARGKQAAIGAGLLGGGILIAWAGYKDVRKVRRVKIAPMISTQTKGIAAKVVW